MYPHPDDTEQPMPAPSSNSGNPFREAGLEIPVDHARMVQRLMKNPSDVVDQLTPFKYSLLVAGLSETKKNGAVLDIIKKHVFNGKVLPPGQYDVIQLEDKMRENVHEKIAIAHPIVGIATEAAELAEAAYNYITTGTLDVENIIEELGDLEFYLAALRAQLVISRNVTLLHNLNKLLKGDKARYKEGKYSDEQANLRRDKEGETK